MYVYINIQLEGPGPEGKFLLGPRNASCFGRKGSN